MKIPLSLIEPFGYFKVPALTELYPPVHTDFEYFEVSVVCEPKTPAEYIYVPVQCEDTA